MTFLLDRKKNLLGSKRADLTLGIRAPIKLDILILCITLTLKMGRPACPRNDFDRFFEILIFNDLHKGITKSYGDSGNGSKCRKTPFLRDCDPIGLLIEF